MEIAGSKENDTLTLKLSGRLDTNTSPELEGYLRQNIEGEKKLIIDLSDAQYVSSAGLRVFLYAHKEMQKQAGEVVLKSPNVYVADVLDATGFTDIMTIEN